MAEAGGAPQDDYFVLTNASATSSAFYLRGGKYGMTVSATFGGGSVTLQKLAPDASTYVTALTAFTAAGYATVDLPPGQYKVAVATATAVYAAVDPIPIRSHL